MRQEYKKTIKVKSLWLAIKHHFLLFFSFFGIMLFCGFIASNFVVKKEYQSSIKLENQTSVSYIHLNNLADLCVDKRVFTITLNSLSEKNIVHESGKPIIEEDLSSGVIAPKYRENGYSITIIFQSTDKTITKPVLDELGKAVLDFAGTNFDTFYSHFRISGEASNPIKISQEKKTFFVFLIVGAIGGYFICFIKEIVRDPVQDKEDVEDLCKANVFVLSNKNKKFFTRDTKAQTTTIDDYSVDIDSLKGALRDIRKICIFKWKNTSDDFVNSVKNKLYSLLDRGDASINIIDFDHSKGNDELEDGDIGIFIIVVSNKTKREDLYNSINSISLNGVIGINVLLIKN